MLLRFIKLTNFRQYIGDQIIDFSCDENKNVTVILGDNTSGKTTVVQAFNWCLFGSIGFKTQKLLNKDIENNMFPDEKKYVSVEIGLTHDGTDYTISRTQEYLCQSVGNVRENGIRPKMTYLQPDGQTRTIEGYEIQNSINKILPEGLSSYFFFDGERISSISSKQDVAESVKGLMGLNVLSTAMDHLNPQTKTSVTGKLKNSLDIDGNENAIKAKNNLESQQKRLEIINHDLINIQNEIDYYQAEKEKAAIALKENKETAEAQKKKEQIGSVINSLERSVKNATADMVSNFNRNAFAFFGMPLIKEAIKMLKNVESVGESVPHMDATAIDYILERGKCICGTEVIKETKEEQYLLREKDLQPPKAIGSIVRDFCETSSTYLSANENYYDQVKSKYMDVRRYKKELGQKRDELENISQFLLNKKDVKQLEEDYRNASKKLKGKDDEKTTLIEDQGVCKRDIERYQKAFDSLVKTNEKNAHINECIAYSQAIYDWIYESYTARERDIRESLQFKVNEIFSKMYHGRRTIKIDQSYKVQYSDITTDESGGLETVKNFAFIAGLVDLAREKIISKNDDEFNVGAEPYPLVMDAPFSKADEKHVSNISRILPEIAEQVIMVIMAKDWTFAEAEMENKVGKMYQLLKESETITHIKPI